MADSSSTSPPSQSSSLLFGGGEPAPMLFPPLPRTVGDRFIPVRSAIERGAANYFLTQKPEPFRASSPSKMLYRNLLKRSLDMDRKHILSFRMNPRRSLPGHWSENYCCPIKLAADYVLDCPNAVERYMVNCLDWSCDNNIAIGLQHHVFSWNAVTKSSTEVLLRNDESYPVTSISWSRGGQLLAIGLENCDKIELWDMAANCKLRSLRTHRSGVLSLAWNEKILACGCNDGKIYYCDVSSPSQIERRRYSGHDSDVCCVDWASSGSQLASGDADGNLLIWDQRMASCREGLLYRLKGFDGPVNTISWSPFESNLLASGGGVGSSIIKFWNTNSGCCRSSFDTGTQVCDLLWSKRKGELLSAHGVSQSNFVQWSYPSMVKKTKLIGHTSSVLSIAQSPDGCRVASIDKDETLRVWTIPGKPETVKPKITGTFASHCYIR